MMLLALISAVSAAMLAQVPAAPGATSQDFEHAPASPGSWAYTPLQGGSQAYFMDTSGTIRLFLNCSRPTRTVTLSRTSGAPASLLTIWTSTMQRNLPARFDQNGMRVSAAVTAVDPLLDALAFSRGRIAVMMPGTAPLVIDPGPEAARVIEDCRI